MSELTCHQCCDLAAELALDVLPALERAQALAHLDRCVICRDTVSSLTVTADRLIELLPEAQPPPGFEQRVLAALTPSPTHSRRRWVPVTATMLILALAAGGWITGEIYAASTPAQTTGETENDSGAGERTVLYAPLTTTEQPTTQRQIGHAYVYPGNPSWIYLTLDTNTAPASETIHCEVVRQDGSTVPVGTFPLTHGHGAWGGPAPVDRDTLTTAKLINGNGRTLATARFRSPSGKPSRPARRSHGEHPRQAH